MRSIGRRHFRVIRQYWPLIDIAVLRSGNGSDCPEAELAKHVFYNFDEAAAWSPDAAIIANPAIEHLTIALKLARLGVPLLIEKPVGSGLESFEDWNKLLHLSKDIPIVVAYVLRHDPCADFVKDQLQLGVLGKLIEADFYCGSWLPDWRPGYDYRQSVSSRRDLGGGVLLELSHEIDMAHWLMGPINHDFTLLDHSDLLEISVEDKATIIGRSVDNCFVSIRLNFCTKPSRRNLSLRGSLGEIHWDLVTGIAYLSHEDSRLNTTIESSISSDYRYCLQMNHFLIV